MNKNEIFETIFGSHPEEIKGTCIITPFLSKETTTILNIKRINKGHLYLSGSNDKFTLIVGKMGAGFIGDAVLYLNQTKCDANYFVNAPSNVRVIRHF